MVVLLILFVSAIGVYLYNQGSFSVVSGTCEPIENEFGQTLSSLDEFQEVSGLSDSQFSQLVSEFDVRVQNNVVVQCDFKETEVSS